MYLKHWGLKRLPFDTAADDETYFPGLSHQSALLKLRYVWQEVREGAVILGPAGVGKSFLANSIRRSAPGVPRPIAAIPYPQLSAAELVSDIAVRLGSEEPAPGTGLDAVLRRLETRLVEFTRAGTAAVISIDDAHLIDDHRVWEMLLQLGNLRQAGRLEFSLLLWGRPELMGLLRRMHHMEERLPFVCSLHVFSAAETAGYVRHRMEAAGGNGTEFDDDGLLALHELSQGIPRRIDRLCDFALLVGCADGLRRLTRTEIEAVGQELPTLAAA